MSRWTSNPFRPWVSLGGVAAALLAHAGPAHASLGGPAAGAVSAQTVKLPSGPGSVRGLADNAAVSAFSGQVEYSVPIDLPSGPGGIKPSLSLSYSGALGNGPLGLGWGIGQAGVRRSLRLGVPRYDASDELEVVGLASGELVPVSGGYRVEGQGNSMVAVASGGGFVFTDSDGRTFQIGTTPEGQMVSGNRIAEWYLERVTDVAGDSIEYHYTHDQGEVYLSSIVWGPDGSYHADLVYKDRPDAVVSWRTGFKVTTARRLDHIEVYSFKSLWRTTQLEYDPSFRLSRLSQVSEVGPDGAKLPPLTLHYAAAERGQVQPLGNTGGWALNKREVSFFDVDKDGAMDLLRLEANNHQYRRNLGGTFGEPVTIAGGPAATATLSTSRLLDLNGDSGAELVRKIGSVWKPYRLVNDAWVSLGTWLGTDNLDLFALAVTDLNGDYRMDALAVSGSGIKVWFGTETGFTAPVTLPKISPSDTEVVPGSATVFFPDLNGDGLADAVSVGVHQLKMFLGHGDGTFEPYKTSIYPWGSDIDPAQVRLGDLDRDGLTDLVWVSVGHVHLFPGLPSGGFDSEAIEVPRPAGTDSTVVVTLADTNGNGSEDVVWSAPTGMWALDLAGPTHAGMLVGIDNGMGQTQAFAYKASAQLAWNDETAGQPWQEKMPVSIPVTVTNRLTLASGDPDRTTLLAVRDGAYDRTERRFLGFREAVRTVPGATAATTVRTVTRFHPGLGADRALRGEVLYEAVEDGNGTIFRETENDVTTMAVTGLPDDPRLKRGVVSETRLRYREGTSQALVARTRFVYDGEGRVTEEHRDGRTDLATDDAVRTVTYAPADPTTGVRDKVCEEFLYDGAGAVVAKSRRYFGDSAQVLPLCAPAGKGWVRDEQSFLAEEARWVSTTRRRYDAHGNAIETYAGGVTRTVEYDEYGLFAVSETVAPRAGQTLTWTADWDYGGGALKRVTEPSGVVVEATYDGLGRLLTLATGQGVPAYVHYAYDWSSPRPRTDTFTFDGDPANLGPLPETWTPTSGWRHTVDIANSAGESLYSATQLAPARWIVGGGKSRDSRGRVVTLLDRYYVDGSDPTALAPPDGTHVQTVVYDALDRVTEQHLANGSVRKTNYWAFGQQATADGLAPVTSYLDGQGRITRTERTVAGTVESVDATYDAAGRILALALQGGAVTHRYTYDSLGRLTFATDPDIGDRHYLYDDRGFLIQQTNGAGQSVSYDYDDAGRVTSLIADDGSHFAYHYDTALDPIAFPRTASRLAWVEEPTGRVQVGYDLQGRQSAFARTVDGITAEERPSYAPSGLLRRVDYRDGLALDLGYDPAGRPIHLGDLWDAIELDAPGRIVSERFGNSVEQGYEWDPVGLAKRVTVTRPSGAPIYDVSVLRTAFGAIDTVTDNDGVGLDQSAHFTYDGAARLTDAVLGQGPQPYTFRYGYDGLQNMIRREASGPTALGVLTGVYRYGEATAAGGARGPRQLTSIAALGSAPGAPAQVAFDYDAAGREIRQGDRQLSYNGLDQLIRVSGLTSGGAVEHAYGFDGLRVRTRGPDGVTERWFTDGISQRDGVREHYVRLGNRLIARVSLPVTDGDAVAATGEAAAISGGWLGRGVIGSLIGLGLLVLAAALVRQRGGHRRSVRVVAAACATAQLFAGCASTGGSDVARRAVSSASRTLYYHQTIGAGPTLITRQDATVFEERRYEPFGAPLDAYREVAGSGGQIGAVDFAADSQNILNKQTDVATGWSYHGARWLAPETGRWLTPDPPVKAPQPRLLADPWSLNPYQYAHQNPVLMWDPDGMDDVCNAAQHGKDKVKPIDTKGLGVPSGAPTMTPDQATKFVDMQDGLSGSVPVDLSGAGVVGAGGMAAAVRIPIPGSNGLYLELSPRGWTPRGGSTSTVFLQSSDGATHLRLDYGYNVRTQMVDYHWNQKGTFREFGINDHTSVPELEGLYKGARAFKYAGRALLVVGIALDAISIWQAEDKLQETVVVASGWAGAWAGAKAGGMLGAEIGSGEPGAGTAVGGLVGGFIGGVGGYMGARWAARKAYVMVRDWHALPEVDVPQN